MITTFKLTKQQVEKLKNWQLEQNRKLALFQIESGHLTKEMEIEVKQSFIDGKPTPYTGTIGGLFTYTFTPTTLGTIINVENNFSKESLNITECIFDK